LSLLQGVVILVATPGRLLDHLKNTQSFQMKHAQYLVLDEADRLLDLVFENQIKSLLELLEQGRGRSTKKALQVVMVSATITPAMDKLSRQLMGDHTRIDADASKVEEVIGLSSDAGEWEKDVSPLAKKLKADKDRAAVEAFSSNIPQQLVQHYMLVTCKLRLPALASFLRRHAQGNKVLVFVSTCDSVDFHAKLFQSATWPGQSHTLTYYCLCA